MMRRCTFALQAVKGQLPGLTSAAGTASKWRWVFSGGGRPPPRHAPPGSSDLYFTGDEDGRVRVWDATGSVPGLLATVPFDSGGPGVRLRPVSSFQVTDSKSQPPVSPCDQWLLSIHLPPFGRAPAALHWAVQGEWSLSQR